MAGLRPDQVRLIDVDDTHALRADLLAAAVDADRAAELVPCLVMATIGTTSSLAVDPVEAMAPIAEAAGMWLHVDGAMAGSAAVCPEFRTLLAGVDRADSFVFNPHKWLFTTFDCSCFYVADRSALLDALSILPEFLRNAASESGAVVDYRDWQVPLGRRFRALKLWFVLRWYGAEGLRHHVREHVRLAGELAARIEADPRLELAAPGRAEPRLPPPRRRRRRHRGAARGAERHRPRVPHPHPAGRSLRDPGQHRRLDHRAAPRRRPLVADRRSRLTPVETPPRVHRRRRRRR